MEALSDDLLAHLLSLCDTDQRIKVLPLVCTRFARVLRQPGECWRRLDFVERRDAPRQAEAVRLHRFIGWARPRMPACQDLRVDYVGGSVKEILGEAPMGWVDLLEKAGSLRRLEVQDRRGELHVFLLATVLGMQPHSQLAELHLISSTAIRGLVLGRLTALQRLNLVVDSELPTSLDGTSTLPPSLTWLGLTPAPMKLIEVPAGFVSFIPRCVLELPALRFLDLSESVGLVGLEEALPALTGLTGLALDHAELAELPRQLSLLTTLRLLSFHGTLAPPMHGEPLAADLTPLASLRQLRVLSLSECLRLPELPPAVMGLTGLRALHLEQSVLLAGLPATLHLPRLQMLSVDWVVLASSHTVLTRQERLEHLLIGGMHDMGDELDTGAVCASLAACPALQRVTFIVYPPLPRAGLTVACTQLLLRLPRECPHLDLQPLDAGSFFLTHSEDLAEADE